MADKNGQARERYKHVRNQSYTPKVTRQLAERDKQAFDAGAQYALDRLLTELSHMTVGPMEIEHGTAADILERVQTRGPL